MIFFSICQNFSVFRRGPHQRIFEIFEKVQLLVRMSTILCSYLLLKMEKKLDLD